MSQRRDDSTAQATHAKQLQKELHDLKAATVEANASDSIAQEAAPGEVPSFDSLSRTEQAAASLGVAPEAWSKCHLIKLMRPHYHVSQLTLFVAVFAEPIAFMNNAHYKTLLTSNALDDTLARRIEAFKSVAAVSS
tara:strand:+ start:5195 stop:5602 length:408 start_codon:yes stop_codon:yes gene_type:complete